MHPLNNKSDTKNNTRTAIKFDFLSRMILPSVIAQLTIGDYYKNFNEMYGMLIFEQVK